MPDYCPLTGKQQFLTKREALRAARNVARQRKGTPSIYLCDHCHTWHHTHYDYAHSKAIREIKRKYIKPEPRKHSEEMKIIIESASNDDIEVSIRQTEEEKPQRYIGITIADRVARRAALITYEQALELVEALKIQIAKL